MLLDDRRCEEATEEVRRAMGGIYGDECSPMVFSCPEEWICFFSDFSDTRVMFNALYRVFCGPRMLGEELWPCINERLFLLVRGSVFPDDWFDNGAAVRRGLELLLLRAPEKGRL